MAPERLHKKSYNHKADVWAIGALFYNLLTGHDIFGGQTIEAFYKDVDRGRVDFKKDLKLSLEGLDFINGCLQQDVKKRLSW